VLRLGMLIGTKAVELVLVEFDEVEVDVVEFDEVVFDEVDEVEVDVVELEEGEFGFVASMVRFLLPFVLGLSKDIYDSNRNVRTIAKIVRWSCIFVCY